MSAEEYIKKVRKEQEILAGLQAAPTVETPVVEHRDVYVLGTGELVSWDAPGTNVADVMLEQFDYLFDHVAEHKFCREDCEDCQRFDNLQRLLLAPFVSKRAA